MTFTSGVFGNLIDAVDCCPWGSAAGRHPALEATPAPGTHGRPLYTPEQRLRRDASSWTVVQGVLAPLQFGVFAISLGFVLHYLLTGNGLMAATASIVIKTLALYTIMVTGSIWERQVFGRYLFAPAFFWEDVFSMLVLALHTLYLAALFTGALDPRSQMLLALAAYTAYVVNAAQFIVKLRTARLDQARWDAAPAGRLSLSK